MNIAFILEMVCYSTVVLVPRRECVVCGLWGLTKFATTNVAVALPLVLYLYSAIQRTVLRNLIANFKIFIHGYSFVDTQPFELIPCPYKNIHSWGGWILKSSRLNSVSTYDERFWPWFTAERAITLLSFLLTPFPPLFHNFSLSLCVRGHTHLAGGTEGRLSLLRLDA